MATNTPFLPALRSRDFRLIAATDLISVVGSYMQSVGVAWQLWQLTHSAWMLGALAGFRVVPTLVLGLVGGVVADAVDRRRLLIATQLVMASTSAVLAVLTWQGHVTPGMIYGLAAVAAVATSFDVPAAQALVPSLVPPEDLPNALSVQATVWQIGAVVGPAAGGVVLAKLGLVAIYVTDVVSFLGVIAALVALQHRQVKRVANEVSWSAMVEGLVFLRRRPILLSTMLLDFVATFFGGSMLLMPMFADQILKVGAVGLGPLYSAQPVGAVLAAMAMSVLPPVRRQGAVVLWAVGIYGAAIAAFGSTASFPLALLMLAVSGAADTVSMVVRQTLRQTETPDEMRGRVTAAGMMLFQGGPQLGEVEAGAVARFFGGRVSVVSGGLLCVVAAIVAALAVPALRRYVGRGMGTAPTPST